MRRPALKPISSWPGLWHLAVLFLAACALFLLPAKSEVQPAVPKEYQLKAAFLFRFMQFVEWPPAPSTNAPIYIGVLGNDPFGAALDEVIKGESLQGRKLMIRRSHRAEDMLDCHLVFVSRSEKEQVPAILSKLDSAPVLTVSDTDVFARQGGIVSFYLEGKKVRFEINPAAARHNGLKLSSQLLGLGRIVEPSPPKGDK